MRHLSLLNQSYGKRTLKAIIWLVTMLWSARLVFKNKMLQRRFLIGSTIHMIVTCSLLAYVAVSSIAATFNQSLISSLSIGDLFWRAYWLMGPVILIAAHIWLIDVSISRLITLYKHEHNQQ